MAHGADHDSPEPPEIPITELAEAYLDALLDGDETAAEVVLREAMDAGLASAEIYEKLIAPALWLVGEMWERGELTIAEEHLATEITVRVLALQREAQRVTESRSRHGVLLATPPGERHVVALSMVANLLRAAGYHVLALGAEVPAQSLVAVADRHGVDVICLSSTLPGRANDTLRMIDDVRRGRPSAQFVIGGRGLKVDAQLRHDLHACERVSEAVEAVDAVLQRARLN
jgi:MerR family transcriptional regulator, light-induced transcriptional regulator